MRRMRVIVSDKGDLDSRRIRLDLCRARARSRSPSLTIGLRKLERRLLAIR